ncbi:hypothetical protein GWP26_02325 [Corynebacterium macginleyi]|uniref:hypothetical protein n=1 Tax=Corynebacterium macginleyi TaxID=38290 RepID=UPI00190B206B|nr:hypothetical protein [Corynebacterium macginleyi]MBK4179763.1 hypothetical protein [Corynebacterium macginleyi]
MRFEKWEGSDNSESQPPEAGDQTQSRKDKQPSEGGGLEKAWSATRNTKQSKRLKNKDRKLAKSVEETELQRLGQSNKLRPWFMGVALAIAGILVLSSCFVAIWLTIFQRMTDAIGVGFIVSLGVETIGVVAIIAHYLFATPDSSLLDEKNRQEEQ